MPLSSAAERETDDGRWTIDDGGKDMGAADPMVLDPIDLPGSAIAGHKPNAAAANRAPRDAYRNKTRLGVIVFNLA
ncbi:MAG: hypothetical protein ACJ78Q_07325 [Chloroflexia bacterium]